MFQKLLEASDSSTERLSGVGFGPLCLFWYAFQELDHQSGIQFLLLQAIFLHLRITSCFQSNLLKCYQHSCLYPEVRFSSLYSLRHFSMGKRSLCLLAYHWFLCIIYLGGYMCTLLKVFSRNIVLFLHVRSL